MEKPKSIVGIFLNCFLYCRHNGF